MLQECNLSRSGMQLKKWFVREHPSRLGMQLKDPVYKKIVHTYASLSSSAVVAIAVSLLRRQNGDGSEKERAKSLAQKWKRRQRA